MRGILTCEEEDLEPGEILIDPKGQRVLVVRRVHSPTEKDAGKCFYEVEMPDGAVE